MNRMWLIIAVALALCAPASAQQRGAIGSVPLLTARTTTGSDELMSPRCDLRTFHATGTTSAGAGAATILIEGSDIAAPVLTTNVDWVTLGTISLTLGTTKTGDGFASQAPWRWVRARVSAISGTNASVDAYMGC